MSFDDVNQSTEEKIIHVDGQDVDMETGEIKEDGVVDFRARQA